MTQKLIELTGVGRDRLHLYWVSSAEAQRFAQVATEVTEAVKTQGPLDAEACALPLAAAEETLNAEILRWIVGKAHKITTKGDVYGRPWDAGTYEQILDSVLEHEYQIHLIRAAIQAGHGAPRTIAAATGMEVARVSFLLADMEKRSMVEFRGMEDRKPVFAAI